MWTRCKITTISPIGKANRSFFETLPTSFGGRRGFTGAVSLQNSYDSVKNVGFIEKDSNPKAYIWEKYVTFASALIIETKSKKDHYISTNASHPRHSYFFLYY